MWVPHHVQFHNPTIMYLQSKFQNPQQFALRYDDPFYEQNIYESLQAAARYIKFGGNNNNLSKDICYVILTKSGAVYLSENLNEMLDINTSIESVLQKLTNSIQNIGVIFYRAHTI